MFHFVGVKMFCPWYFHFMLKIALSLRIKIRLAFDSCVCYSYKINECKKSSSPSYNYSE